MPNIVDHPRYKYKTFSDIPSEETLTQYYAEKYFLNNPNYANEITQVELDCKRDAANFLIDVLQHRCPESVSHIVEIGSGEGFFLASAHNRGLRYQGFDFSTEQLHPDNELCRAHLQASSTPLKDIGNMDTSPTCIVLRHVIEHVPDAVTVVNQLANVLTRGSVLVIEAPYDFKPLQSHVMQQGLSEREYWIAYPDHLSYFSPEQLASVLIDHEFAVLESFADFPIELLLLSDKFNYQKHKEMGKPAHLWRCAASHYLHENTPFLDLLALYRAFASTKIGRSFTMIAQRK